MSFVAAVAALLTAYNNATNLLGLPDRLYVPANLTLAGLLVAAARRRDLTWAELGLAPAHIRAGARWGAAGAAAVAGALALGLVIPAVAPLLQDARVTGLGPRALASRTLVRIPLGTVVLEEVAFRGVLLGGWAHHRPVREAVAGSGVVFGLWHVGPMLRLLDDNDVALDAAGAALAVGSGVTVTALAGVALALLRLHTRSLVAPALVHVATNAFGTLAAAAAQRS